MTSKISNYGDYNEPNLGIFASCSGVYDKYGKYNKSSESDIIKCCMHMSVNSVELCRSECENKYGLKNDSFIERSYDRCMLGCDIMITQGTQSCQLLDISRYNWGTNSTTPYSNPYFKCAAKHDCYNTDLNILNPECLQKNRSDIHNCCRTKITPSSKIDQDKNCDFLYRINTGEFNQNEEKLKELTPNDFNDNINNNINNINYAQEIEKTKYNINNNFKWMYSVCFILIFLLIIIHIIMK